MKFKSLFVLVAMLVGVQARAWDCSNPANWSLNVPGNECYHVGPNPNAPAGTTVTGTQTQGQGQTSTNANGQGQTQNATGGAAKSKSKSASSSSAVTGPSLSTSSALTGPSSSTATNAGNTLATSNVDSGNVTYRQAANVVQPATMIIAGCQVQGQAGGSNTRAAGMLGIGFTPKNCYDYIQAQAYLAIGATQAACEILNHTEAAQRAVKNGAVLPSCAPVVVNAVPTYTKEQVETIVRKAVSK